MALILGPAGAFLVVFMSTAGLVLAAMVVWHLAAWWVRR